jgi:hypothetical protein
VESRCHCILRVVNVAHQPCFAQNRVDLKAAMHFTSNQSLTLCSFCLLILITNYSTASSSLTLAHLLVAVATLFTTVSLCIYCSGCKIAIRGRGSVKEGARRGKTPDEEDDLHVYISGETEEQVEIAAKEVCTAFIYTIKYTHIYIHSRYTHVYKIR